MADGFSFGGIAVGGGRAVILGGDWGLGGEGFAFGGGGDKVLAVWKQARGGRVVETYGML